MAHRKPRLAANRCGEPGYLYWQENAVHTGPDKLAAAVPRSAISVLAATGELAVRLHDTIPAPVCAAVMQLAGLVVMSAPNEGVALLALGINVTRVQVTATLTFE